MEDNYFLRITGSVNIPVPLEKGHDYSFTGNISVYGANERDNHDGTESITFQAQFTDEIALIKGEQTVLAKSKLSQSQKMRKQCIQEGIDYDRFTAFLLHPEKFQELVRQFEQV